MKFDYKVKYNGKYYAPGEDVPVKKNTKSEKTASEKQEKDEKDTK